MINELEQYAKENNIPIMEKDSINFIQKFIQKYNIKNILEIGSAIGYSAISFARINDEVFITTIEKDNARYLEAVKNINAFGLQERINLVFNNALNLNIHDKFDLIIIDAAKTKNIELFDKFKDNLNSKSFIIIDNINFHGYVGNSDKIESNNLKKLVIKIENSIKYLKNLKDFKVSFLNIGDGLAVCQKI